MADETASSTTAKIHDIVGGLLAKRALAGPIGEDRDLRDAGLTSIDTVTLMLAVEEAFEIEIPQDQMTPDNFRSISAISRLVNELTC